MKREFFVIGMVALLVLTVFGSVAVTAQSTSVTQKVVQKVVQKNQIVINGNNVVVNPSDPYAITPGVRGAWGATLYNVHDAFVVSTQGFAILTNSSGGSKLATTASVPEIVYGSGTNVAYLGVKWHLKPGMDWAKVKGDKVLVTALVSYDLSGGLPKTNGFSSSSVSTTGGDPMKPSASVLIGSQKGAEYKFSTPKPVTVQLSTTLENLSTANGQGIVAVKLLTDITGGAGGASTAASGNVTVYNIQLTWL
jgi:hypothetical protein